MFISPSFDEKHGLVFNLHGSHLSQRGRNKSETQEDDEVTPNQTSSATVTKCKDRRSQNGFPGRQDNHGETENGNLSEVSAGFLSLSHTGHVLHVGTGASFFGDQYIGLASLRDGRVAVDVRHRALVFVHACHVRGEKGDRVRTSVPERKFLLPATVARHEPQLYKQVRVVRGCLDASPLMHSPPRAQGRHPH